MMYLIFSLIDSEFKTPRSQKETNKRIKIFAKIIDKVIEDHFNPQTAISVIGTLGENLLKRNPDLENREEDSYIF